MVATIVTFSAISWLVGWLIDQPRVGVRWDHVDRGVYGAAALVGLAAVLGVAWMVGTELMGGGHG